MTLSDFDYDLPEELIAQEPLEDRAASRMLVVDRTSGRWEDRLFRDLPSYLRAGDCLALNDTRVIPSRLFGQVSGRPGQVEIFLLRSHPDDRAVWRALVRPGKRVRPGAVIRIADELSAEVLESVGPRGERTLRFYANRDVETALEAVGHVPLPPYIRRGDRPEDRTRYQTVYADRKGSVAAPTAGLHFTPEVLNACQDAGASVAQVTLHVGLGTFQPLAHEQVEQNELHSEWFEVPEAAATAIGQATRVIGAGTTSVRTLESAARAGLPIRAMSGETNLFIYPGYSFAVMGAMLTNFHVPKSSLLILVSAFAGRELTLAAYQHAVRERYRFFSYGDCMLLL